MKSLINFGLATLMTLSAACSGAVDPNDDPTGGTGGTGGGENGGSAGIGGNLPFDSADIQLNDVSILFPLPKTNQERDQGMLAMNAKGAHGVLLPEALYTAVGPVSGRGPTTSTGIAGRAPYKDLRVVAARIDPCFAELDVPADGEGCENQLRLVVQEVRDGSTFDSALHLFYTITREELLDLVSAIGGLRQALRPGERLGKLQPHPIMVEEGLAGSMSKGVRGAILAHAGQDNLIRVTRMTEFNGPFWDFSGFDIVDGKTQPMQIPTLTAPQDLEQTFLREFSPELQGSAEPPSGSEDDFMVLMNPPEASALSEAEQRGKLTALVRIENPNVHSPNTVDCVTCHIATPATKLVVEPTLGLSAADIAEAFAPTGDAVSADELEPTFENNDFSVNVHAFSYDGELIGINQRTVNESAAVVQFLSEQTFGR
jgi:hypothetical protein